ncbi:hypothetical protein PAEPH01_1935 [Pancytospora epiphaga]|nr:hypothetical protein PAEPH01_1935 [Pancytospora epiphaga]
MDGCRFYTPDCARVTCSAFRPLSYYSLIRKPSGYCSPKYLERRKLILRNKKDGYKGRIPLPTNIDSSHILWGSCSMMELETKDKFTEPEILASARLGEVNRTSWVSQFFCFC